VLLARLKWLAEVSAYRGNGRQAQQHDGELDECSFQGKMPYVYKDLQINCG